MARAVIVEGGGTGDAAAFALRKRGFDGDILILSADSDRPYDRPYLSKEFLRGEIDVPKVFLHDESDYAKERIELRLGERVTGGGPGHSPGPDSQRGGCLLCAAVPRPPWRSRRGSARSSAAYVFV